MLIVWPDSQSASTAARSESGILNDHDERAAPIAQEQEHHQARQHRAERAFDDQARESRG